MEPDTTPLKDGIAGLPEAGGAGRALRATDWSKSPLGPIASWPTSLKAIVRAMLSTRQATCLFWGSALTNLYNDGFIPLLGEKHPKAMGQAASECWSDAWPVVGTLIADVIARGKAVLFEEMLIPIVRQGRLEDAWWNYSYSPTFDDDGLIVGVLVVATETTAEVAGRKQLLAAKAEADVARQELHNIFMQAPLPMALLKDSDHRFTLVNEPYRLLVNREVQDRTVGEAFTEAEAGYYKPFLDHVYATGESVSLQEAPLRIAGAPTERFIDVAYHPYRNGAGDISGVLAIVHDVTSKVAARTHEAELRKSAEAASRAKDEFLATVSHELRNPLNAILGWSRLLGTNRDPARLSKGLMVIEKNALAQAKLIEDILDVSRITSGKVVLDLRRIRFATVVRNAVESIRPAAAAKGITLLLQLDETESEFVADEDRLQQVVWNLLSNAVKFTPEGGEVRVSAIRRSSRVTISVEDTGKGISPDLLPFVFDRFRQGDGSTTRRYSGLGLGLAIVRQLVELHGGTVSAQGRGDGLGSRFEISLPVRAVEPQGRPAKLSAMQTDAPAGSSEPPQSLADVRILVVDDEDDARDIVATVLREAGAEVMPASSVDEAMRMLATFAFAAIVSDIGMAGEDGYSFIQRFRSVAPPPFQDLPALALTAYARTEDRERALAAGYQRHAAKPIDPDVLVMAVSSMIRREV